MKQSCPLNLSMALWLEEWLHKMNLYYTYAYLQDRTSRMINKWMKQHSLKHFIFNCIKWNILYLKEFKIGTTQKTASGRSLAFHVFKKYNSIQIILLFFFVHSFHFHHIYKYEQDTAHYFHPSKNTLLDTTKKKLTGVPHCVRSEFGPFTILANPKSAIFMLESSVGLHSSKFSGFKSRCATLNEWQYSIASSNIMHVSRASFSL